MGIETANRPQNEQIVRPISPLVLQESTPQQPAMDGRVLRRLSELTTLSDTLSTEETYEEARISLSWESPTSDYTQFFNRFWREEGLSKEWHTLKSLGNKEAGFNMTTQMNLLRARTDQESLGIWAEQTERDMRGFCLEYLTKDINILPFNYTLEQRDDGTHTFIDHQYGDKDMLDTISEDERNGSVMDSTRRMRDFFLSHDGMAVMVSPPGESGLTTDKGEPIIYEDALIIVCKKEGDRIDGLTFQTDFSHRESREVIRRLSGIELADDAPLEEYNRALALLTSESQIKDFADVAAVLQDVRTEISGSPYIYGTNTWEKVWDDLGKRERLYEFGGKTRSIIDEFKQHVVHASLSEQEQKEAVAATVMRLAQLHLFGSDTDSTSSTSIEIFRRDIALLDSADIPLRFGSVMNTLVEIPGCAGGGKTAVSTLGGIALGTLGSDSKGSRTFPCPACGKINVRPWEGFVEKCQHCNSDEVSCETVGQSA
ncbi:MAG TPA: hypothetical protein VEL70_00435 [Candidatus Acidoferrum sp.]|nr:hypothetical protein [Candidatus Acidoferrum sp.]